MQLRMKLSQERATGPAAGRTVHTVDTGRRLAWGQTAKTRPLAVLEGCLGANLPCFIEQYVHHLKPCYK